jgi:hypothetical protein
MARLFYQASPAAAGPFAAGRWSRCSIELTVARERYPFVRRSQSATGSFSAPSRACVTSNRMCLTSLDPGGSRKCGLSGGGRDLGCSLPIEGHCTLAFAGVTMTKRSGSRRRWRNHGGSFRSRGDLETMAQPHALGARRAARMTLWFSSAAVTPPIQDDWELGSSGTAWLIMAVQIGLQN